MPGRKYLLVPRNDSNILAYERLISNIALSLGADRTTVLKDVNDYVEFEMLLANVSTLI